MSGCRWPQAWAHSWESRVRGVRPQLGRPNRGSPLKSRHRGHKTKAARSAGSQSHCLTAQISRFLPQPRGRLGTGQPHPTSGLVTEASLTEARLGALSLALGAPGL